MISKIINSKSKSFLTYCFSFLIGISIASALDLRSIDTVYMISGLLVAVFFLIYFRKDRVAWFWSVVLLTCLLGIWRYSIVFPTNLVLIGQEYTYTMQVVVEPDVRIDSVKYILKISEGEFANQRVYIGTELYPRYEYGDILEVTCELERPEPFDTFRYDMYLGTRRVFLTCNQPSIYRVQSETQRNLFRSLFVLKSKVADQINQLWPEPYASFMAGLLYGYRGGLGSLQELFNITGVTHIIAISGYNITIVSMILFSVLLSASVKRQRAFWLVVLGIGIFVIFVGASASVVRAGVMGILVLVAKQIGRVSRIGNVLALTAVLMTLYNPLVLFWDAGFQLSFLATVGLVYLAPDIETYVKRVPELFGLRESMVATLAATVITLPIILLQFGQLSLVAPVVNMLILPLIPFIMATGFISVVLSFIIFPLGEFVSYIAYGGMVYITSVVQWFANLSFASVAFSISVPTMIVMYGIIFIHKKNKR